MDTEERMLPAEAGANGQAYYFEGRNPMQKYFDSLDDYTDHSPSLALTEYIMCPVISVVVTGLIVAACTYFKLL